MQSSLISKIEKAKRYAQEPERIKLQSFMADFHGENSDHKFSFMNGIWHCTCHSFSQTGTCSHIMAFKRLFSVILPADAASSAATDSE
jgi:hypothetical protein